MTRPLYEIRATTPADKRAVAELRHALWPVAMTAHARPPLRGVPEAPA